MIPPPFKKRFHGDCAVDVGVQEIDVLFPGGERRRVVLRIGTPFQQDGFDCLRCELENLDRTDGPLRGKGTLAVLVMGVSFIIKRLQIFEQELGCRYFWPESDQVYDYREVLSTKGLIKRST